MSREELLNPNILREITGFSDAQTATNLTEVAFDYGTDISNTVAWSEIFKRHFPDVYKVLMTTHAGNSLTEIHWYASFQQQYLTTYRDDFTRNVVRVVRDDDAVAFMMLFAEKYANSESEQAMVAGIKEDYLTLGMVNILQLVKPVLVRQFAIKDHNRIFCSDLEIDICTLLNDSTRNISNCIFEAALELYGAGAYYSLICWMIYSNQPVEDIARYAEVINSRVLIKNMMPFEAVIYNRVAILQYFIENHDIDINYIRLCRVPGLPIEATLLHFAVVKKHQESLEFLLQQEGLIIPVDILECAIYSSSDEICQTLINYDVNIALTSGHYTWPPLFLALTRKIAIAELIINKLRENPAWNINTYNVYGLHDLSLLQFAFGLKGKRQACELLLRYGADLLYPANNVGLYNSSALELLCCTVDHSLVDAAFQYVRPEDLDDIFLCNLQVHRNTYILYKILSDNPWATNHDVWPGSRISMAIWPVCNYIIKKMQDVWTPGRGYDAYSRFNRMFDAGATNAQKIEAAKEVLRVMLHLKDVTALEPYMHIIRRMEHGAIHRKLCEAQRLGQLDMPRENIAPAEGDNNSPVMR